MPSDGPYLIALTLASIGLLLFLILVVLLPALLRKPEWTDALGCKHSGIGYVEIVDCTEMQKAGGKK